MLRRDIPDGVWKDRNYHNTYNINTFCLDWLQFTGKYDMPVLKPCHLVPDKLFPYDERDKWRPGEGAIHFFTWDSEMESCWLRANRYPHMPAVVQKAGACTTPDFSVFVDWPLAIQIWNVYRSRLLGALWSHMGIQVIPSVVWADESSFEWCFDGLPIGGTFAVSTAHVNAREEKIGFTRGFRELLKRCEPDTILCYGQGMRKWLEYLHPDVRRYEHRLTQIHRQRKAEMAIEVENDQGRLAI